MRDSLFCHSFIICRLILINCLPWCVDSSSTAILKYINVRIFAAHACSGFLRCPRQSSHQTKSSYNCLLSLLKTSRFTAYILLPPPANCAEENTSAPSFLVYPRFMILASAILKTHVIFWLHHTPAFPASTVTHLKIACCTSWPSRSVWSFYFRPLLPSIDYVIISCTIAVTMLTWGP